ncbi:hypothetical protein [Shimazuella kribbensis]|uniref:hypothetical protein n=1 Tax=Shimazuella kribbensis TaxID=139808 RepID=UPI000407D2DF|nr:hypothetical protein [Shimazuella kribbensis]
MTDNINGQDWRRNLFMKVTGNIITASAVRKTSSQKKEQEVERISSYTWTRVTPTMQEMMMTEVEAHYRIRQMEFYEQLKEVNRTASRYSWSSWNVEVLRDILEMATNHWCAECHQASQFEGIGVQNLKSSSQAELYPNRYRENRRKAQIARHTATILMGICNRLAELIEQVEGARG